MSNVHRTPGPGEVETELKVVDFVAGRLSDSDRMEFEGQVADDPALAALVAEERELKQDLIGAVPTDAPSADSFDRIAAMLDEPAPRSAHAPVSTFWSGALAAGVLALAMTVVLMQPAPEPRADFYTLSSEETARSAPNQVRIVFAPDVTAAQRSAVAERLGFEFTAGPGPGGSYVVATPERVSAAQLVQWRSYPEIVLAELMAYEVAPQ